MIDEPNAPTRCSYECHVEHSRSARCNHLGLVRLLRRPCRSEVLHRRPECVGAIGAEGSSYGGSGTTTSSAAGVAGMETLLQLQGEVFGLRGLD